MVLYVDGGCSGNGQRDMARRRMVMVVTDAHGAVLLEDQDTGGSNNIAELRAVLDALRWCRSHEVFEVEIRTDSRNNLAWVNGLKVGRQINDRDAVLDLKARIERLREPMQVRLVWVPREKNKAGHYIESKHGL